MGSALSCVHPRMAQIVPTDGGAAYEWPIPALVYNIMVARPGYQVVDALEFAKRDCMDALHFSVSLRPRRIYLLVPVNNEGRMQYNVHSIRSLLMNL